MWERLTGCFSAFNSEWLAGITSRPLCGPRVNWMPLHGPVAYHCQLVFLTAEVISLGQDHERPSFPLCVTNTRRVSFAIPRVMPFSLSEPRFRVMSNQTSPVTSSRTGAGLPHVLVSSDQTICCGLHLWPPSVDRFSSR